MFENCYALTAAPDLPATGLTDSCYMQMFNHCSGLVKAPETLPGTSLAPYCYKFMFRGANITKAPTIMAISYLNQTQAMNRMFYECSNLSSIEVKFTYWPAGDNSMINWVDGVAANGTFICPSALGTNATITRGVSNCPQNWNVVQDVQPEYDEMPLTFKSTKDNNTVKLSKNGNPYSNTFYYSKNGGEWTAYELGTNISFDTNETVAFSGTGDHFNKDSNNYYLFELAQT